MKDIIRNLVVNMYDASIYGGGVYASSLRQLSFELDINDNVVEDYFNDYMDREYPTEQNIQALVAHLYYLYLEDN